MQLETDVAPPSYSGNTRLVSPQSPLPRSGDTGLPCRERSTGHVQALAHLPGPCKEGVSFSSSVQERRMAGESPWLPAGLRLDRGAHCSVQTTVLSDVPGAVRSICSVGSGAQSLGVPWGRRPLSLTNVLPFVVTLSSSPYGHISDDSRAN